MSEREHSIEIEIGHVLFMDIVGFSKLLVDEQTACSARLNHVVRQTRPFALAAGTDKLFRLPTGDGMVLVFFTNLEAPVHCALEIAHALKANATSFGLRMGIHSGPVNKIFDVNDRANLAGIGLNLAQRVMDCGDAGHILLSRRVAEDLEQLTQWQPLLHDLGECEVKHGQRVQLVSLYDDEVGNAAIPSKIARAYEHTGGIQSLAVKPLDNYSGDPSKEYFADGMTDELTTKLSQIVALKTVISRARMMKYKHATKSCREIAFELNVEAVVQGSVVLAGNSARVTAQLVEGKTENNLWGESYTYDVANIIQLQNEVALAIANAIALKLTPAEEARLTAERVVNPQAYKYYLRGKSWRYGTDDADADARIDLLEKAVHLDDKFAEAYAELSDAYSLKAYFFTSGSKDWEIKAEAALERALEIDPNLPDALMAHARFLWRPTTGFQHEKTIVELKRALAQIPNSASILAFLAVVYFHVGLLEDGLEQLQRSDQIDPDNPSVKVMMGLIAMMQGRYAEAVIEIEANVTGMVRSLSEHFLICALCFFWARRRRPSAAGDGEGAIQRQRRHSGRAAGVLLRPR